MKPEIKQRIEQIKAGQVPDGYKRTKIGIVPKDWEKIKVLDFIQEYNEKTTVKNQHPVLTSSRKGMMLQTDYYSKHQITTDDNIGYNIIPRGYITYRNRSDDGNFRFNENTIIDKGIVSYFYPVFSFKNNVCHTFALDILNFTIYRRMFPYIEGTAQQVLSIKKLGNLEYYMPCLLEQEKIAKVLSTQDRIIELYQRKIEELQKMKKIYLSKMFPKKGENVPEWRFPQFNDSWEQRKFGDLGSVAMCKRIFKEQTSTDGDIPFYKIGTFGAEPDAFISRELFKEYRKKFQYPNVGDMLISASGTIGRTVEYKGEEAYFQDSNIVWFKHDDRVDNLFLKCIYKIVKWSGIEGSTIKRLYNDNFLKTEFSMPKVAEQQQIGMYFQSLDHLITLHQRKLEENKKYKNALMQLLLTGIVRCK